MLFVLGKKMIHLLNMVQWSHQDLCFMNANCLNWFPLVTAVSQLLLIHVNVREMCLWLWH